VSSLTPSQRSALEWIARCDCYESAWIKRNTALLLTGNDASIEISADDWYATADLHEPNDPTFRPMWRLTPAGVAALQAGGAA